MAANLSRVGFRWEKSRMLRMQQRAGAAALQSARRVAATTPTAAAVRAWAGAQGEKRVVRTRMQQRQHATRGTLLISSAASSVRRPVGASSAHPSTVAGYLLHSSVRNMHVHSARRPFLLSGLAHRSLAPVVPCTPRPRSISPANRKGACSPFPQPAHAVSC